MDDTQDQARCDFPISGDIIFVVSTNGAHPVMAYQTALSRPRPELVHVATVLTPVDVLEANIGKRTLIIPTAKRAITLPPREWSEARGKNQKYRILRRTDISLQSKQERMIEAGSYYMDEKYDFLGIFKDDPHRLGFSICSSLAHKVLLRSQLVDADTLPGSRNLLPGELFVGLERCGWIEVGYDKYFDDHISELIPISPIFVSEQRRKYRAIMRSFLPSLVSIQEMAKNAGVTRRDFLRVECMLTNQHIFVVLAKEMARLFGQRVHIESREGVPAKHWAEENIAVKEWKQRLVQNQIEVREFVEASYEICK